jgi:hypothetical protein
MTGECPVRTDTRRRSLLRSLVLVAGIFPVPVLGAEAAEPSRSNVVVLFAPWRDPTEGAFTLNVPKGWKVTGGTSRKTNVNVRHHVRVVSPGGGIEALLGDPALIPNQVPDSMTTMAGFREGQVMRAAWGGDILLARFVTGETYARNYAASKLCRSQLDAKVSHLDGASRELAARAASYGRATGAAVRASVGEATFQCGKQSGYTRAATLWAGPSRGRGRADLGRPRARRLHDDGSLGGGARPVCPRLHDGELQA